MRAEPVVPCIRDGTDLTFAMRPGCQGPGVIGTNQTRAENRGLHLHSTLAGTPGDVPLGVLKARFDAPPEKEGAKVPGDRYGPLDRGFPGLRGAGPEPRARQAGLRDGPRSGHLHAV